jgi:hypothetical protein
MSNSTITGLLAENVSNVSATFCFRISQTRVCELKGDGVCDMGSLSSLEPTKKRGQPTFANRPEKKGDWREQADLVLRTPVIQWCLRFCFRYNSTSGSRPIPTCGERAARREPAGFYWLIKL